MKDVATSKLGVVVMVNGALWLMISLAVGLVYMEKSGRLGGVQREPVEVAGISSKLEIFLD